MLTGSLVLQFVKLCSANQCSLTSRAGLFWQFYLGAIILNPIIFPYIYVCVFFLLNFITFVVRGCQWCSNGSALWSVPQACPTLSECRSHLTLWRSRLYAWRAEHCDVLTTLHIMVMDDYSNKFLESNIFSIQTLLVVF